MTSAVRSVTAASTASVTRPGPPIGTGTFTTTTVALDDPALPPSAFRLDAPYPNPFSTTTIFSVETARPGLLRVDIVDVLGRAVRALVEGPRPAGRRTVVWDGRDAGGKRVAGGVYFARLLAAHERAGQAFATVRKVVVLR